MTELWGLVSAGTLVGALVGVLLGEGTAIAYDQREKRIRERERRERAADSLRRELGAIDDAIDAYRSADGPPNVPFTTGAYESCVASGTFALFDADVQQRVSETYGTVTRARAVQDQLQARWYDDDTARLEREFATVLARLEEDVEATRGELS